MFVLDASVQSSAFLSHGGDVPNPGRSPPERVARTLILLNRFGIQASGIGAPGELPMYHSMLDRDWAVSSRLRNSPRSS